MCMTTGFRLSTTDPFLQAEDEDSEEDEMPPLIPYDTAAPGCTPASADRAHRPTAPTYATNRGAMRAGPDCSAGQGVKVSK